MARGSLSLLRFMISGSCLSRSLALKFCTGGFSAAPKKWFIFNLQSIAKSWGIAGPDDNLGTIFWKFWFSMWKNNPSHFSDSTKQNRIACDQWLMDAKCRFMHQVTNKWHATWIWHGCHKSQRSGSQYFNLFLVKLCSLSLFLLQPCHIDHTISESLFNLVASDIQVTFEINLLSSLIMHPKQFLLNESLAFDSVLLATAIPHWIHQFSSDHWS